MFEWASKVYVVFLANVNFLLNKLVDCYAVERLWSFASILLGFFVVRIIIHLVISYRLKKNGSEYSPEQDSRLFEILDRAKRKVKLSKATRLYRIPRNMVLFTMGTFKPTIFIAPALVEKLSDRELEAAIVHELTHIKRLDNGVVWASELIFASLPLLIILFFGFGFVFDATYSLVAIWGTPLLLVGVRFFVLPWLFYRRELSCDDLTVALDRESINLASALVKASRLAQALPKRKWPYGFTVTQALLPATAKAQHRIRRLINYRRPRFKHLVWKWLRLAVFVVISLLCIFVLRFHSLNGFPQIGIEHNHGECKHSVIFVESKSE